MLFLKGAKEMIHISRVEIIPIFLDRIIKHTHDVFIGKRPAQVSARFYQRHALFQILRQAIILSIGIRMVGKTIRKDSDGPLPLPFGPDRTNHKIHSRWNRNPVLFPDFNLGFDAITNIVDPHEIARLTVDHFTTEHHLAVWRCAASQCFDKAFFQLAFKQGINPNIIDGRNLFQLALVPKNFLQ